MNYTEILGIFLILNQLKMDKFWWCRYRTKKKNLSFLEISTVHKFFIIFGFVVLYYKWSIFVYCIFLPCKANEYWLFKKRLILSDKLIFYGIIFFENNLICDYAITYDSLLSFCDYSSVIRMTIIFSKWYGVWYDFLLTGLTCEAELIIRLNTG